LQAFCETRVPLRRGQITKLKAIKRSMYGRAKFDLLRQRALYAA